MRLSLPARFKLAPGFSQPLFQPVGELIIEGTEANHGQRGGGEYIRRRTSPEIVHAAAKSAQPSVRLLSMPATRTAMAPLSVSETKCRPQPAQEDGLREQGTKAAALSQVKGGCGAESAELA